MNAEQKRLNAIADNNEYDEGVNGKMVKYTAELFRRYMKQGSVLEMGPAQGLATDILHPYFADYSVLDAVAEFIHQIRLRHSDVKGYVDLFEDFDPPEKYDNIILSHVLEHVENPVFVLSKCRKWLKNGGVLCAAVPNGNSLHRQVGVKLGMLKEAAELHEGDLRIGHRRVYDLESFIRDFYKAGFTVRKSGGYWLKPISSAQIERTWSEELIQAYMEMGEEYPDMACNIYIIAE